MRAWGTSQVHSTRRDHEHRTRPRTCADPIDWIRSRSERNLILKYTWEEIRWRIEGDWNWDLQMKWWRTEWERDKYNYDLPFNFIFCIKSQHHRLPIALPPSSNLCCHIFYLPDLMESNNFWGFTAQEFFSLSSSFLLVSDTKLCGVSVMNYLPSPANYIYQLLQCSHLNCS